MAPYGTALEFLPICGVVGIGRLLAQGRRELLDLLRGLASDPRWRVREAVAIALQALGDADMDALLDAMDDWSAGNLLEQRAAVAALCEPRLLADTAHARRTLALLDRVTQHLADESSRRDGAFRVLRQALGYGWSVALVAEPVEGRARLERWLAEPDADIRWIMRSNLRKARLRKLDPEWVARWEAALA